MDYGKSGAPNKAMNAPKHTEHNSRGTDKNPFGQRPAKAELLARMKADVAAKKKGVGQQSAPAAGSNGGLTK